MLDLLHMYIYNVHILTDAKLLKLHMDSLSGCASSPIASFPKQFGYRHHMNMHKTESKARIRWAKTIKPSSIIYEPVEITFACVYFLCWFRQRYDTLCVCKLSRYCVPWARSPTHTHTHTHRHINGFEVLEEHRSECDDSIAGRIFPAQRHFHVCISNPMRSERPNLPVHLYYTGKCVCVWVCVGSLPQTTQPHKFE